MIYKDIKRRINSLPSLLFFKKKLGHSERVKAVGIEVKHKCRNSMTQFWKNHIKSRKNITMLFFEMLVPAVTSCLGLAYERFVGSRR